MKRKIVLFSLCVAGVLTAGAQKKEVYKDPKKSADARAWDLLQRMTLQQKISQMVDISDAIPEFDMPKYNWWNEALHGVARSGPATVFPQAIGMAATFNTEGVWRTFDMVSDEARAQYYRELKEKGGKETRRYYGLTFWTPNINIFRDPRWGRGQETYGEDPYLTTQMGLAVVRGLQGDASQGNGYDKSHACAKHFAVHSGPEADRHVFNAKDISSRDLWETYLPAFEALVRKGNVKEVMCAYNAYEGEPCCASKTLEMSILRDKWGFQDVIVSDCGAISDIWKNHKATTGDDAAAQGVALAVKNGTDLECGGAYKKQLEDAVRKGYLDEETTREAAAYEGKLNASVFRLLRARFQLGMFDNELKPWYRDESVICSDEHKAQALRMARESMVLLSNDKGVLPLDATKINTLLVVGPNADNRDVLMGNYSGRAKEYTTIINGFRNKLKGKNVIYAKGCEHVGLNKGNSCFNQCSIDGRKGLKGIYWNSKNLNKNQVEGNFYYDQSLNFSGKGGTVFETGVNHNNFSASYETIFKPSKTEPVVIHFNVNWRARVIIDGEDRTGWVPRADITLDGIAGKEYRIKLEYQAHDNQDPRVDFDILREDKGAYASLIAQAKKADAIIFAGGLNPRIEGEEMGFIANGFNRGDRTCIELPESQKALLRELRKATDKPIVFVLGSGSAVALDEELKLTDALLAAWYPGQEGGTAVADVLFGDYNPAGRLPVTFYRSTGDLPDYNDYDMINTTSANGKYTGRTYRYFTGKPLFPFGYGLSYTTFKYGKAKLDAATMELSVPLTNTGDRDGEEVVQIYFKNPNDAKLNKALCAYRRVALKKGESTVVKFKLPATAFATFDGKEMSVTPGTYKLLYGGTSDDAGLQSVDAVVSKKYASLACADTGVFDLTTEGETAFVSLKNADSARLDIYDICSSDVDTFFSQQIDNNFHISLAKGVYRFIVSTENGDTTEKFVVI